MFDLPESIRNDKHCKSYVKLNTKKNLIICKWERAPHPSDSQEIIKSNDKFKDEMITVPTYYGEWAPLGPERIKEENDKILEKDKNSLDRSIAHNTIGISRREAKEAELAEAMALLNKLYADRKEADEYDN